MCRSQPRVAIFNEGGSSMVLRVCAMLVLALLMLPFGAEAQKPIKVGFPMIMSGPGALFGEQRYSA